MISSLLKNVFEAADARQKLAKKRSLHGVCRFATPHFEPVFNAAAATQIVFQQAVRTLALIVFIHCTLSACSLYQGARTAFKHEKVEPWQRDVLAQDSMQLIPDPMQSYVNDHIYFSKEAATGGKGVGGGGCGCN